MKKVSLFIVLLALVSFNSHAVKKYKHILPFTDSTNGIVINYGYHLEDIDENFYNMTKIDYVKAIINKLLEKDKANGGKLIATLIKNKPHLVSFNHLKHLETRAGESFFDDFPNSQDLQADEVFPNANKNNGLDIKSGERDASIEEIVHLIHNYAISETYPKWQAKLDELTKKALKQKRFNWNKWHELPRQDLDDEYFAASVEAFYNLKTEGGYLKDNGASGKILNKEDLKRIDPEMYKLIAELFPENIKLTATK